jgi:UDP-N-acetylglucosamine 1-carboxyvinyltransferase
MMGEDLVIKGGVAEHQTFLIEKLRSMGATITEKGDALVVNRANPLQATDIETQPYPGFPTDMQAQLMAAASIAHGSSTFSETVFENRFMHVAELGRMGANIRVDGGKAIVRGVEELSGATVMATDLRASACLVLAALAAEGESVVRRIYHLDRGYESIETKLSAAGAKIERFKEEA